MMKRALCVATALASVAIASQANAAVTLEGSGSSRNINGTASCAAGTGSTCTFTDTLEFVTPTNYNRASFVLSSSAADAATDLNFTSVLLNGISFRITNGYFNTDNDVDQARLTAALVAGASNTISIMGTVPVINGVVQPVAYGGTVSFSTVAAAVPEPATWAMMLVGFALIGATMRYRQRNRAVTYA